MRNIKITIEYDGTDYCGWQTQKKGHQREKTIQETLENALSTILNRRTKLIASGRTDAGVHAQGQVANFRTDSRLLDLQLKRALNSILPQDIRIKELQQVSDKFHARFCAKNKLYRYTIVNDLFLSPFIYRYAHLVKQPLNISEMKKAAAYFLGRHDFRSFCVADKVERDTRRRIRALSIKKCGNIIGLDIEADGFLHKMARNIVGTLVEVGRGALKSAQIPKILKARDRRQAGPCAPAQGLCLIKVEYKTPFSHKKG